MILPAVPTADVGPHPWKVSCPVIGVDHDWITTEFEVPLERSPGSIFKYKCLGENMKEGADGEKRSSGGAVECLPGNPSTGVKPAWNISLVLPCTLYCPEGFSKTVNNASCLFFSTTSSPHGIVGAALECAKLEASLALVGDPADLISAEAGFSYFTASTSRGTNVTDVSPAVPSTISCTTSCDVSDATECITLSNSAEYQALSCSDASARFICIQPASCPSGYAKHKGLCYKVVEDITSILSGQETCVKDGSALAYPQDLDALSFISNLVRRKITVDPSSDLPAITNVAVGLNEAWGNWDVKGIYVPSADIMSLVGTSSPSSSLWRFLTVPVSAADVPTLTAASFKASVVSHAVCQLHGPIGCSDVPPVATANMILDWDFNKTISTVATYTCYQGHFVGGNTSVTEQTLTCLGDQLGGWYPKIPVECIAVEVCTEPLPDLAAILTNTSDDSLRFFNGTASYDCPVNMGTVDGNTTQTITCSYNGSDYFFISQNILPCNVCMAEPPPVLNQTETSWSNSSTWEVGMEVTVTCLPNHLVNLTTDTQRLMCTDQGWDVGIPCYPACVDDPPDAGSNMTQDDLTWNGVGTVIRYNCTDGFYVPTTEVGQEPVTSTIVICDSSKTWTPAGHPLYCTSLCLYDPIGVPSPGNTSWNAINRTLGTQVELSCPEEHYFGDMNETIIITCEETGNWTSVSEDLLVCRKAAPENPPEIPAGANLEGQDPPYFVGTVLNFTCEAPQMSASGDTYTTIKCTETGWTTLDPEFSCLNVCSTEPPPAPPGVRSDYNGAPVWGSVVNYFCPGHFMDSSLEFNSTCNGGTWTPTAVPSCFNFQIHSEYLGASLTHSLPVNYTIIRPCFNQGKRQML